MQKLIALCLIVLPLALSGTAHAGKFAIGGRIDNPPTTMKGTSSQWPPHPKPPGYCSPSINVHPHPGGDPLQELKAPQPRCDDL